MGFWKEQVVTNSAGERFIADVWQAEVPGDGCTEIHTKRKLAAGEVWPPPKAQPAPDPEAVRRARELEGLRRDIQGFVLDSADSPLDERDKQNLRDRLEWERRQ
jgi:hypothetical protein